MPDDSSRSVRHGWPPVENRSGSYVRDRYTVQTMRRKLTRTGNSVALVLDKPLLEQLGLDENSEVELSSNGDVLVITPLRSAAREKKFRKAVDKINTRYAGLFRRLAE